MSRARAFAIVALLILPLVACSSKDSDTSDLATIASTPPATAPATLPPATTTRATTPADVQFMTPFPDLPPVAGPTAMLEVPGQDWMLLAIQDGRILGFPRDVDASEYTIVWDHREATSRVGSEEGLLGMALSPSFATDHYMYVYYSAASTPRRTMLARLTTTGIGSSLRAVDGSELTILEQEQPYSNHKGGQVAFGPDGMLYIGLGDGGSGGDPLGNGQDITRNWLGSIIRIDVSQATAVRPYTAPEDNPFAKRQDGALPETWAYGLRNPWRFSFDAATGTMWIGDVGQSNWEEVNIGEAGGNYGWNIMEGSRCYQPPSNCDRNGLILPVVEYSHSDGACSITGGYVYRGSEVEALSGFYLYGDYCSGVIQAIDGRLAAEGEAIPVTTLRRDGPPIVTFAQDEAGEIYVLHADGTIERITS